MKLTLNDAIAFFAFNGTAYEVEVANHVVLVAARLLDVRKFVEAHNARVNDSLFNLS